GVAGQLSSATDQPPQIYNSDQLVSVLERLQAQTLLLTQQTIAVGHANISRIQPQSIAEASRQMLVQIAQENKDGAVASADMQTIDLVGMLFEYMLSDDHLPDSIKALLSYLHTPFLKIAFIDKGFFEQPEHPARV